MECTLKYYGKADYNDWSKKYNGKQFQAFKAILTILITPGNK